jgi:aerobic-type carbon monoxide dehydrogenase small subunit (CoxS/CutS family)
MKTTKERKKGSSPAQKERDASKTDVKPAAAARSAVSEVAKTKVSRRALLKGTAATAAVAGVAVVALKGKQNLQQLHAEQSTSSTLVAEVPTTPTDPFGLRAVTLNINGTSYNVQVEPRDMLVDVLRDGLGLIATKRPCNRMECGGCAVLINGAVHYSCTYPAILAGGGKIIMTAEAGAGTTPDPVVAALVQAWVANDAGQCGYCSPGMMMASTALLKSNPNPTVDQIKMALSGNLCRCGAYLNIIEAVQAAAASLASSGA